eukprot:3454141-Alexandrium_andersonii.AAC.1
MLETVKNCARLLGPVVNMPKLSINRSASSSFELFRAASSSFELHKLPQTNTNNTGVGGHPEHWGHL